MKKILVLVLVGFVNLIGCVEHAEQTPPKTEESSFLWRSPGGVDFKVRNTAANITKEGQVNFYTGGSAVSRIADWPEGKVKFRVKLGGAKALGQWPCAEFYVDTDKVGKSCATNGTSVFEGSFKKKKEQRDLTIRYVNDAFDPKTKEDRNLQIIDFIRL